MGGKSLPWYLLGMSDASDMFDICGTMWMVITVIAPAVIVLVLKRTWWIRLEY